jgi:hypothetical protein
MDVNIWAAQLLRIGWTNAEEGQEIPSTLGCCFRDQLYVPLPKKGLG